MSSLSSQWLGEWFRCKWSFNCFASSPWLDFPSLISLDVVFFRFSSTDFVIYLDHCDAINSRRLHVPRKVLFVPGQKFFPCSRGAWPQNAHPIGQCCCLMLSAENKTKAITVVIIAIKWGKDFVASAVVYEFLIKLFRLFRVQRRVENNFRYKFSSRLRQLLLPASWATSHIESSA